MFVDCQFSSDCFDEERGTQIVFYDQFECDENIISRRQIMQFMVEALKKRGFQSTNRFYPNDDYFRIMFKGGSFIQIKFSKTKDSTYSGFQSNFKDFLFEVTGPNIEKEFFSDEDND